MSSSLSSSFRARPRHSRGLTRVEALIIGAGALFAAVAAVVVFESGSLEGDARTANTDAARIREAARTWRADHQGLGCPSISQLQVDHVLDTKVRIDDPWGGRYRVLCSDKEVTVRSPGRDRTFGTVDDVRVPKA